VVVLVRVVTVVTVVVAVMVVALVTAADVVVISAQASNPSAQDWVAASSYDRHSF
jgi:hypothetical protein